MRDYWKTIVKLFENYCETMLELLENFGIDFIPVTSAITNWSKSKQIRDYWKTIVKRLENYSETI